MASLDYIDIPPGATRLRSQTTHPSPTTPSDTSSSSDIRPAPKILTSLPHPSPPPSPRRRTSSLSSVAAISSGLTSPTLSFLPQLLLSSSLPASVNMPPTPSGSGGNGKRKSDSKPTLLSSKDPLSIPIMTGNFKRFVARVGPVFWLQDRVEEIVLWKRGWKVTGVWMAGYAFLCYFPRLLLLLPHFALILIILSTYRYPDPDPAAASPTTIGTAPLAEDSVDWQANIQAIQNLMGAYCDAHALITPYLAHLTLGPLQIFTSPTSLTATQPASAPTPRSSPYTPHILALLLLSLPPLAFVVSLPAFPVRAACLVVGLTPVVAAHPRVRALAPFVVPLVHRALQVVVEKVQAVRRNVERAQVVVWFSKNQKKPVANEEKANATSSSPSSLPLAGLGRLPVSTVLQRLIDDDRLSDECWNAEMREVELWENERWGALDTSSSNPTSPLPLPATSGAWSKQHLKPSERAPWTRGRDGWSAVAGSSGADTTGRDSQGEVSSNLTFSLAPGWAFVDTEDWRRDLGGEWSGCGADRDGWVYTNDAWLGARPAPYTAGGGSVTRRRRWVRRVWYDPARAGAES